MEYALTIPSPVGNLTLQATDTALTVIRFGNMADVRSEATPLLQQAAQELTEYFAGTRREFTIPLAPSGTEFQQAVWKALRAIPYGQTRSYKQIADLLGNPKACRAVGLANNRNPIAIVIPCHRVVGHNGSLVGYAGGMTAKQALLEIEK